MFDNLKEKINNPSDKAADGIRTDVRGNDENNPRNMLKNAGEEARPVSTPAKTGTPGILSNPLTGIQRTG